MMAPTKAPEEWTLLPPEVRDRLAAFLEAGKSGSVELHVNCGTIESWKVIEAGRIKRNTA